MARMPAGQPRSVPDAAGEALDEMLRQERLKRDRAEAVNGARGNSVGHPGFAESLIPVWGSGREAVADFQEGDYGGAALNGALAVSDVFLAGAATKAGLKIAGRAAKAAARGKPYSTTWGATQKRMKREGYLAKGEHGHHWLIPQNGWGKHVPAGIKNAHWNVKPLDPTTHGRIHHRVGDLPKFNPVVGYVHGTPTTAKVVTGAAVGRPAAAGKAQWERR